MQFNYTRLVGKCALIVAKLILAISMLITRKKKKKKKIKKEELVKNVYFHLRLVALVGIVGIGYVTVVTVP